MGRRSGWAGCAGQGRRARGQAVNRAALGARGRGEGGRREREREKKKKKKKKRKRERAGGKFGGDRDGRSRVGDRQPRDAGWDGGEEKEGGYGWRKKKIEEKMER